MRPSKPLSLNDRLLEDLSSQKCTSTKSAAPPLHPPPPEEKPVKVKLQGRRRLCKLSSLPSEDNSQINDIPQIRDILDTLTSKLDSLTIEKSKKRINKTSHIPSFSLVSDSDLSDSSPQKVTPAPEPKNLPYVANDQVGERIVGTALEPKTGPYIANDEVEDGYFSAGSKLGSSNSDTKAPNKEKEKSNFYLEDDSMILSSKNGSGEVLGSTSSDNKPSNEAQVKLSFDLKDEVRVISGSEKGGRETLVSPRKEECKTSTFVDVEDSDGGSDFKGDSTTSQHRTTLTHILPSKVAKKEGSKTTIPICVDDCEGVSDIEDDSTITLSGTKSTYILPGKVAKMLYPHQRDGLRWLWNLHCRYAGGILGDDMGLGKTMQVSAFLAGLFHSSLIKRVLIVAPKTLLSHWIKELSVVGLSDKTREYFGTCVKLRQYELQYILQDKGLLLTTYDIVRNNSKSLRGESNILDDTTDDCITWDYIILDEGHIIKNPNTQRAKSLLDIPSSHRIIISGTPIQNNLKELWALFNFCCPEVLGDKKEFKETYENPILRGNDKNASEREKHIGSRVAKELRERIKPYFLRRLKSEVFLKGEETKGANLSKKHELIVWLRLTQCQRQLYEAFLNSELVLSSFDGSPLAALMVLKKICDHPFLLTKKAAEGVLEGMDSMLNRTELGMVEEMASRLANMTNPADSQEAHDNVSCKENLVTGGHNVLIFSQTRKMLNLIQDAVISRGYTFLRIDGSTKASDREKIVNDFQEGLGAPIFLLTSQVGGLGLTLTKADRVIVVDPAWNPSTDNQSVDRAYRIGQNKDVIVYRLMTCGSIEEKIYKMQVFKGALFKSATEHREQTRYFSQKDLRELFALPKQGFDVSLTQQQLHEEHDSQHTMDEYLKDHIAFLESQGIAGVSHHSLLFSKTAPVSLTQEAEKVLSARKTMFIGSSTSSSLERAPDGAAFAFNPKDKEHWGRNTVAATNESKEVEIKKKIERLHQTLENKAMVSVLPDKGEKIRKQILELSSHLDEINQSDSREKEVIDLDEITLKLQKL